MFIDDLSVTTDGKSRTWFDGIGYAPVRSLSPADFDADGVVDLADYQALMQNLNSDLSGLSRDAAFERGDLNGDGRADVKDFFIFRDKYNALHGPNALAKLLVPEPGVVVQSLVCGAAWLCRARLGCSRQRPGRGAR